MQTSTRGRLLASTLLVGASLAAAGHAMAQQAAPLPTTTAPDANVVNAITVTGSRIPQTANLQSVSPIQTVTDQEFKLQGKTDTIDLLNNLPQVTINNVADLGNTSNPLNAPGGVSTVDLRGLGPQRTLVLVNGRRLGIGDPNTGNTNPAPDINQIPAQLIDRVEVLTGGSSATYGSDAVAGVVNFIMKTNLKGLQLDAQWGTNQHHNGDSYMQGLEQKAGIPTPKSSVWDGQSRDASVAFGMGSDDGRAHFTAYATYHSQDPVSYARRDFAACQLNVVKNVGSCSGSSNSNIFYSANGGFTGQYAVVGNTFAPYSTSAATSPPARFNSNPFEYLQHDDTRYTGGYFANYDINSHFQAYSEFSYMHDQSVTQVAPAGLFQGSGADANAGFLVNCSNPLLSAQERSVICGGSTTGNADLIIGRRNVEGGPRQSNYTHENYRIVVGLKGDIDGPWKYDVYASRYSTSMYQLNTGYTSIANTQNALMVNAAGACISGGSCVPYNIFNQGGVNAAQTAYLSENGSAHGETTEEIVEGDLSADLTSYGIKSPMATDGAGLALGAEYRRDHLVFTPDQAELSGDLSGFGGASTPIDNTLSVKELYGELRVPLVQGKPFFEDMNFEGGYRYSDYSTGISANTFKLGGDWSPVDDLKFRISFQRAIRAPNIQELYTPQSVTNTSDISVDPCSPNAGAAATATAAQCANTGVTAAQYGNGNSTNTVPQCPSGQCAVLNGGNPVLKPEEANTFSTGLTFRPSFARGLIASVDYFNIRITDEIGQLPLTVIMNNCLTTGSPTYCSLIHRAPNGLLFGTSVSGGGYITGTYVNIGQATNSGVDVQLSYNMPFSTFGWEAGGSLNFDFTGTYLISQKNIPAPGEHEYDCAGLYGPTCQTVNPVFRSTFRTSWATPWNVLASVAWRHTSGVGLETNTNDATLSNGAQDTTFDAHLPSRDYIDLTFAWRASKMLTLRAGVTNLFDLDPPLVSSLIAGTGTPNTYPSYDLMGRRFFISATANF